MTESRPTPQTKPKKRKRRARLTGATCCARAHALGNERNSTCDLLLWIGAPSLRGVDYSKIITIEPGKRSGQPCIRGIRMTVGDVLGYLAAGMTHEEILAEWTDLKEEDIRACLAFAADRERGTMVVRA